MGRGRKQGGRARARRVGRWLLIALGSWIGITLAAVFVLRFVDPPTSSVMLQRYITARWAGNEAFAVKQRWVPLSRLPRHVSLAVITAEDQRFFDHWGFDAEQIKRALGAHLDGEPLRGASTLTQQVAKNLFLWEGRSFVRKALEAYFTVCIELVWPKRRTLELYLNIAELGRGIFGVGAAARYHFDRDATQLSVEQAALLAAILPSPLKRSARHPSARVLRKQSWILEHMPRATPAKWSRRVGGPTVARLLRTVNLLQISLPRVRRGRNLLAYGRICGGACNTEPSAPGAARPALAWDGRARFVARERRVPACAPSHPAPTPTSRVARRCA